MRIESGAWSGESHGWENTCSGSQVSRCWTDCHETCHGWGVVTRGLMTSWWPWHGCHAVTGTSTLQQSEVAPASAWTLHCLSVYIYTCLARCLDLFDCLCFLEILFWQSNNNNVDPSLPRNSQTDQFGATCVTWLSRERDTWHLCHESVAPVVTSGLLSLLNRDHQSPISGIRELHGVQWFSSVLTRSG